MGEWHFPACGLGAAGRFLKQTITGQKGIRRQHREALVSKVQTRNSGGSLLTQMRAPVFAAILGVELLLFFNMDMFLSGFPLYITGLGISEDRMGVLFGAFMVAGMVSRPLLARLAQRWGQKVVLALATVVAFTAPWLYLSTESFGGIVAVRLFHGLVPGSFIMAAQLLMIRESGEKHKAVGLGLFGLMGALSMMVMPYLGVHILQSFGRTAWLGISSGFGAAAMAIFWCQVRPKARETETARERPAPLNIRIIGAPLASNILLALAFGSVITYVTTYAVSMGYTNPGQFFTVLAGTNVVIKILFSLYGDRLPQRITVIPGAIVLTVGLLLLANPPSPAWIVGSAVPIGAGFFTTTAMMMLNIANAVPGVQRSMAAALFMNTMDLGIGTASIALGLLVTRGSYQLLYSFAAICTVLALGIIVLRLRERPAMPVSLLDTGS